MGQSENCDPTDSGLRKVLQPLTIKPTGNKGQNDPRISGLFDSKCNPGVEYSEKSIESSPSIKCRDRLFYAVIKKVFTP